MATEQLHVYYDIDRYFKIKKNKAKYSHCFGFQAL